MEAAKAAPVASSSRVDSLQVVRGFAALLVVLDHSIENIGFHTEQASVYENLGFQCGRFGVLVFFVISGFIMFYTSYDRGGRHIKSGKFFYNRIRRIVPIYWIVTALTIGLILVKTHHFPKFWDIAGSAFFLPLSTTYGNEMYPLVGQGWTLYYEAFFYLIFGMGLFLRGWRGVNICMFIMSGLVVSEIAWNGINASSMPGLFRFYTQPIIILFVVGIAIGLCRLRAPDAIKIRHPLLLTGILTAVALGQFWLFVNTVNLPPASEAFYFLLASLCVFVCVYEVKKPLNRWMAAGIFLGDASYSIYLVHNLVVGVLGKLFFAHFGRPAAGLYLLLALFAAVSVGCLLHICIERPITAALTRRRRQADIADHLVGHSPAGR